MKKIVTLCVALVSMLTVAMAQEDATPARLGKWTTSSTPALKVSEFIFNNWSSSGNSMIDVTGTFFGNYKYSHPKYVWDNIVDLAYGYAWQDLAEGDTLFETRRKSNDKIDLTSSISWNAYKGWGASFTANLKSQFGNGYEYSGTGATQTEELVSSFFAPAYLTTALSFEHKKENWSVSLSFITGKTTFVVNDALIADGRTYGVLQPDNFDVNDPSTFSHTYFALGSYVKAMYLKKNILKNLDLYARAELFYDYFKSGNMAWGNNMATESRYTLAENETWTDLQNKNWIQRRTFETDLDFELKLDYRLSEHIAANFALNLKWDTDFGGMGSWGHWQIYQMAGVRVFFDWKTASK